MQENKSTPHYIYNVEFTVNKIDLFAIPGIENIDECDAIIQFKMSPDISIEISEDEMIDAINRGEKKVKNIMFSLSEKQMMHELDARIVAMIKKSTGETMTVGTYEMGKLDAKFPKLKDQCKQQQAEIADDEVKISTPFSTLIKELAQFTNKDEKPCGSVFYTLRITCFGPQITRQLSMNEDYEGFMTESINSKKDSSRDKSEYDEYVAQINENSLTVRINKDNPYLVTRVYDSCEKDKLTISGCDQQIDFNFPKKFTCCRCKKKQATCNCNAVSDLTDYQKKTSCAGSTYKNFPTLPAIRGNLKYPSHFEDQSIMFSVNRKCESGKDATEKYRMKKDQPKDACMQIDKDNIDRELSGKSSVCKGIKMYKLACEDDMDVFILKIGRKKTTRDGKSNEIELEMRTPRGPIKERKKMETREIQVHEEEIDVLQKAMCEVEANKAKKTIPKKKTTKKLKSKC